MRVLVTRPAAEAASLAATLAALGHQPLIEPLLEIKYRLDELPPLDGVAALLATSANGVAAFAAASPRRDLPCYAVGDRTAAAARGVGFERVASAGGDSVALARLVMGRCDPTAGALLHAAGAAVAGDLAGTLGAAGFTVRTALLYDMEPVAALSHEAARALGSGTLDAALFFSPRTAAHFAELLRQAGLEATAGGLDAICLSPAVANALAPLPFRRILAAVRPTQGSLLDALADAARQDSESGGR